MPEKRKHEEIETNSQQLVAKRPATQAVVARQAERDKQIQIRGVSRTSSLHAPIMQLTGHGGIVYSLAFSPDGNSLASASFDKTILLWKVFGETCDNYAVLKGHNNAVLDVTYAKNGLSIFSCSADRSAIAWDAETGGRQRKFTEHRAVVNACSHATTSNDRFATVSDDGQLKLWDIRQRRSTQTISHAYPLTAVTFGIEDKTILAGGVDNVVRQYDLRKEGAISLELHGHEDTISGISLSPDGGLLLSNSFDCTLKQWDVKPYCASENRCQKTYMGLEHSVDKNLLRCSFSPDMTMVAAGSSDRMVYVWNSTTTKILYRLPGHTGSVNDVVFHPTEPIIASCANDKTIFIGEIEPI